jgi:hypothetical protein
VLNEQGEEYATAEAVARTLRTMADGTVRLAVDFEPKDREKVMRFFGEPGTPLVCARVTLPFPSATTSARRTYGDEAKALRLSSFFRTPEVWIAVGTDAQYLAFLWTLPCAYCKNNYNVEAAHVRRVANGSGTSIKPVYSAIPLCHAHHEEQHQHGESALGGKAWFDKKRIEYVQLWAWKRLKDRLGYEHWNELPPELLADWAKQHHVDKYLPECYRK